MEDYLDTLARAPLFCGIVPEELLPMLHCLGAQKRHFPKGSTVLQAGEPAVWIGVVLAGTVQVCRDNANGNRLLMAHIPPAGLFGEAYACAGTAALPVSVFAAEESEILLLDCKKIVAVCPSVCAFHTRLIANLLSVLASKSIGLSEKMDHLSKRTLREKLLSYLQAQSATADGATFTIPLDRQALADYLCADRSALSRELGALRREGILSCQRNRFTLYRPMG